MVSCPSSCTLFVAAVDADRAVAVAMVLVDFAATTATPVLCAGSEAAGTVSVAVDHVLDMAPEVAMVLGLLMLRPNRPCRWRRRYRPGFLPDRPLQTCTRTRYWSPRTTQWTSSRNLRLLHHRVRARCMVGGHGWSCSHPRHKITRSRRRPNLRRLCRRGARIAGLPASSVSDASARGGQRWRFFVER